MSGENKDKEKKAEVKDVFDLKIFGVDFGGLLRNWLGVSDLSVLQDPVKAEALRKSIEEQRTKLKEAQDHLRGKFGDVVKFDYDIRVRSLMGDQNEVRIAGGKFLEGLDKQIRERRYGAQVKPAPYKGPQGVLEPFTEVIEDTGHLDILSELPGVEEKDIVLEIQLDKIGITASGAGRTYKTEVKLPAKVLEEPVEKSYLNGILKIRLKKAEQPKTP